MRGYRRSCHWNEAIYCNGAVSCCDLYELQYKKNQDSTGADLVVPSMSEISYDFVLTLDALPPNLVRVDKMRL